MTAGPGCPGRGPLSYQPAVSQSFGTSRLPSGRRPSFTKGVDTSIAGICNRTGRAGGSYVGTEWTPATPGGSCCVGVAVAVAGPARGDRAAAALSAGAPHPDTSSPANAT